MHENQNSKKGSGQNKYKRKKNKGIMGEGFEVSPSRMVRRKLSVGSSPFKAELS